MSVLVNSVIVVALWIISHFLTQWLLVGSGCIYSAALIFSWWFVAYFTKSINTNPLTLLVTFVILDAAIMSAHYAGRVHQLFPTMPVISSSNIWISFMMLAFLMVTPLIFNLIMRYVTKAINSVG
jgi:hypothetical protein